MWVDPDDDLRETGAEPVDERSTLVEFLRRYRLTLEMKCAGLDPEQLARRSVPYWLGDAGVRLHALASLLAQAQQLLPDVVQHARDQELSWADISQLLGIHPATAVRRYRQPHK